MVKAAVRSGFIHRGSATITFQRLQTSLTGASWTGHDWIGAGIFLHGSLCRFRELEHTWNRTVDEKICQEGTAVHGTAWKSGKVLGFRVCMSSNPDSLIY